MAHWAMLRRVDLLIRLEHGKRARQHHQLPLLEGIQYLVYKRPEYTLVVLVTRRKLDLLLAAGWNPK